MAITLDNSLVLGVTTGSPQVTSYTCSGNDRFLRVSTFQSGTAAVTGVTYNGISLNLLVTKPASSGTITKTWGILAPSLGSNSIIITFTGSGTMVGLATSYNGVLQSGLPDATGSITQAFGPTTLTGNITTILPNCWVLSDCSSDAAISPTSNTNVTSRVNSTGFSSGDSNNSVSSGANTQIWNVNSGGGSTMCLISIAPAPVINQGNMFLIF